MHAAAEADNLKVPAKHAVTVLPFPVKPALALQSSSCFEPLVVPVPEWEGHSGQTLFLPRIGLYDPAEQSVQLAGPGVVLYVPGSHCVHADEFGPVPVVPASHPSGKVSTASLEGSPVPVTVRRVTQSEESLSEEGGSTLLPWSLKSLGRVVEPSETESVMEKREMTTGCWNDIRIHWSVTAYSAVHQYELPSNALLAGYEPLYSLLAMQEAAPVVHGVAIWPPLSSKNFSSATVSKELVKELLPP